MKTIWKFPLMKGDIDMPVGARILDVQIQGGIPTLWAAVDSEAPTEKRHFYVVPTGGDNYNDTHDYIGTLQQHGFVMHVFEGKVVVH